MPKWDKAYVSKLRSDFGGFAMLGVDRLADVSAGRVAPALDDLAIGTGREVSAAVSFFDIRGFTKRTAAGDSEGLKRTLFMLNLVIPTVMQIVYDHDGYVEKNTGDGIMAIFGVGAEYNISSNLALDAAATSFFALKNMINPLLQKIGIPEVEARIGIDAGTLLLSRIGMASGSAAHQRNFLTAIGPAANIASKLQSKAGTNEIWASNLIRNSAHEWRKNLFVRKDEGDADWNWVHRGTTNRYMYWNYAAFRNEPDS